MKKKITLLLTIFTASFFFCFAEESSIIDTITNFAEKLSPFTIARNAIREEYAIDRTKLETKIVARRSNTINKHEQNILGKRFPKIKAALETILDQKIAPYGVPRIVIVGSGGGDRAMIGFNAFLLALQELSILDTCSHIAALSGSTWTLASWILHQKPLHELKEIIKTHEVTEDKLDFADADRIIDTTLIKYGHRQPITICDFWGGVLGEVFFHDLRKNPQELRLSQLQPLIKSGNYPFPLFSAVLGETHPYEWLEYSPFEVGSEYLKTWIPTPSFGKKFKEGISDDPAPEQTLGYMLGLFGSAFSVNLRDISKFLLESVKSKISDIIKAHSNSFFITKIIQPFIETAQKIILSHELSEADSARFTTPLVRNFTYKIENAPLNDEKHIQVIDGGFAFNLPFPLVMRRKPNLYICFDSNNTIHPLQKAARYAKRKGYPFPEIPEEPIIAPKIGVYQDLENPEVPIVVHIPNYIDISTVKFEYEQEEFDELFNYMYETVKNANETLIKTLKDASNNKLKLHLLKQEQRKKKQKLMKKRRKKNLKRKRQKRRFSFKRARTAR